MKPRYDEQTGLAFVLRPEDLSDDPYGPSHTPYWVSYTSPDRKTRIVWHLAAWGGGAEPGAVYGRVTPWHYYRGRDGQWRTTRPTQKALWQRAQTAEREQWPAVRARLEAEGWVPEVYALWGTQVEAWRQGAPQQ